jgi:DNA-binding transcriptional ArsR family regulator
MTEAGTSTDLDDALRALSHGTRRAIVRLTAERQVPATELASLLGIAPATASEHLRVLRKTGLVELSAAGTWRRYRADLARLEAILDDLVHDLPPTARSCR